MAGEYLREAYPLTWPERQPRTPAAQRRSAQFKVPFAFARDELLRELERLRARHVVVSSNVPVRRDGLPLADAREPADPAVAVFFDRWIGTTETGRYVPFVIACDTYSKVKWNLRAIGAAVEALRTIERHGSSSLLEQAFTGFAALPPAPATPSEPPWWETLGVPEGATAEEITRAYRELARVHHPDHGGSHDTMARITRALELARAGR